MSLPKSYAGSCLTTDASGEAEVTFYFSVKAEAEVWFNGITDEAEVLRLNGGGGEAVAWLDAENLPIPAGQSCLAYSGPGPLNFNRVALYTAAPQPQQAAPEWEMPDEPKLFKFINETPILQSLLYDINLLPEQIKDPVRWGYLVSLVSHYEMAVINAALPKQEQAAPGAVPPGLIDALKYQRQVDEDGTECGVSRQAVYEAIKILESLTPGAVLEGWQLVPVEPTPEMFTQAGMMSNYDVHAPGASPDADHAEWYRAMLSAAPKPQGE